MGKYLQNYETYITPYVGMTTIQSFGQSQISGLGGSTDPKSKTIDPDDKFEVGFRRITKDLNPTNKILWEKPKRRWRKRREEIKNLIKNK